MFTVAPAELESFHEKLVALTRELNDNLEYLNTLTDDLHANWSGEAAEKQRLAHELIKRNYQSMLTALHHHAKKTAHAHTNYLTAISQETRLI